MNKRTDLIFDALQTWAPEYPRRVGRKQTWTRDDASTIRALLAAEDDDGNKPFISTYSFPRGHTKDDGIPTINTLFIDFDFDEGDYVRGSGNREAWRRDMSKLLVRARKVASVIEDSNRAHGWRASLSGHKGIHLFVDFPALSSELGEFSDYVAGLNDYATSLVDDFAEETGLDSLRKYVDVTSSDLGRLCRVPNTIHGGATESFGETRFCVPITLNELSHLTPERYEELTREPQEVPWLDREPIGDVGEIIAQHVQTANPTPSYKTSSGSSVVDWSRVAEYKEKSNDDLTLDDVRLLTSDMPCVWEFHKREDKYDYGNQSHEMETHCIAKLLDGNFPIDVIKAFLSTSPKYDERYTEERIEELIARDFNPYSTEKLLQRAPEFCGYDWCKRCQAVLRENDELRRQFN